ncbi:MAG: TatD family nuclease-associated radical SAM protein [Eubacteriales bacterium]
MTICYPYEGNLYVNLTNRCNCHCTFCLRDDSGSIYTENSLWLEREPTVEEVVENIEKDLENNYNELVFCGFGEPTYRFDDICAIIDALKKPHPIIRINTNGHGTLINGKDITKSIKGRIDKLSISLNAPDVIGYTNLTRPDQGEDAYAAMLDFATKVNELEGVEVVFTIVNQGNTEEMQACQKLADKLGITLRIREFID